MFVLMNVGTAVTPSMYKSELIRSHQSEIILPVPHTTEYS